MSHEVRQVRRKPSFLSISVLMWLVVVAALILWLSRIDKVEQKTVNAVFFGSSIFLVANLWIQSLRARKCPACGAGRVGRISGKPRSFSYHRCSDCGQRMKQGMFGRLWDASGPEDDLHFVPKDRSVKTWEDGPILPESSSPRTATMATLLRTKLDRAAVASESIANGLSPLAAIDPDFHTRPRSKPVRLNGVSLRVAEAYHRTLDLIRCARSSPPSS